MAGRQIPSGGWLLLEGGGRRRACQILERRLPDLLHVRGLDGEFPVGTARPILVGRAHPFLLDKVGKDGICPIPVPRDFRVPGAPEALDNTEVAL